jgi:hypothetical protein
VALAGGCGTSVLEHVGYVPEPAFKDLTLRFQRACQRFFDQRDQRRRALAGS